MREIDRSYSVLGVRPGTAPEELKRVYRELVREWHPDQFPRDSRQHKLAEEKLKAINVAYAMVVAHGTMEVPEAPARRRPSPPSPNGYSARSAYAAYGGTTAAEPETETE